MLFGAIAVSDLIKSTLGPKGMVEKVVSAFFFHFFLLFDKDKIIMSTGKHGSMTVTNDGATILKKLSIDNAAAKILVGETSQIDACVLQLFFCRYLKDPRRRSW